MTQELIQLLVAFLPLVWLFAGIAAIRMPLWLVGIIALLLAGVAAAFGFSFPPILIAEASLEGFLFALFPIIHVIFGALFVYVVQGFVPHADKDPRGDRD